MLYHIYGLVIENDDPIPGLPLVIETQADIKVQYISPHKRKIPSSSNWFMNWHLPSGMLWLCVAKMNGGYLLRFNNLADFFVCSDGGEITCIPKPETPLETTYHLLLDQVIPLVISLKGFEALHVSAVLSPQGVVAFAGPTGSGKSTLAGSFVNMGYPFLCDDCLVLVEKDENIYTVPAYPGLRLWGDSLAFLFGDIRGYESVAHYTTKQRAYIKREPETYCPEQQPLKRLYIIADPSASKKDTDILIEHLSSRESFMTLVRCAFRLDIKDKNMLKRQFHFLKRVVSSVSVRRLIYSRDFNILPAVRETILADLKDLGN